MVVSGEKKTEDLTVLIGGERRTGTERAEVLTTGLGVVVRETEEIMIEGEMMEIEVKTGGLMRGKMVTEEEEIRLQRDEMKDLEPGEMKDEGGMMRGGGMKVKVEKEGEEIGMIEGDWEEEGEEVIGEEQEQIAEVDLDRERMETGEEVVEVGREEGLIEGTEGIGRRETRQIGEEPGLEVRRGTNGIGVETEETAPEEVVKLEEEGVTEGVE